MAEWDEEGKLLSWDVTLMEVVDVEGIVGDQKQRWNGFSPCTASATVGYYCPSRARLGYMLL